MLYRIADLFVEMDCAPEGRTARQALPYRVDDGVPDIILPSREAMAREAEQLYPGFTADEQEYMVTGGHFYMKLLRFDGMLLHASGLAMDGRGYVFTAPCGTGKSTHAALWQQRFGERVTLLNDDKPALRQVAGEWRVYGTPWSGKTDKNMPASAPLCGICLLTRDKQNHIRRLTPAQAISCILSQTLRPSDMPSMQQLLSLLDRLLGAVPLYELGCNRSVEAAEISFRGMAEH